LIARLGKLADLAIDIPEQLFDQAGIAGQQAGVHHATSISRGSHLAGSSPTSRRILSSSRTVRSRPERIISTSGSEERLSRATTLSEPCLIKKQRALSGRFFTSWNSC